MNGSTQHLGLEELADFAQQRLRAAEEEVTKNHLARCSECSATFSRLSELIEVMMSDNTVDAPRDVIQYAINIFRKSDNAQQGLLERIVAVLSFDSLTMAPAHALRSGAASARHLIYSAGDHDIDLRVAPEGRQWSIAGQVLGRVCPGGEARLENESVSTSASLNELCEFRMPLVDSGNYTLRLLLTDLEVEVPALEIRS